MPPSVTMCTNIHGYRPRMQKLNSCFDLIARNRRLLSQRSALSQCPEAISPYAPHSSKHTAGVSMSIVSQSPMSHRRPHSATHLILTFPRSSALSASHTSSPGPLPLPSDTCQGAWEASHWHPKQPPRPSCPSARKQQGPSRPLP